MPFSLLPKVILPEVTDISAEFLRSKGVRLLMLDFDNTIVPYTTNIPTDQMIAWLDDMKNADILLCVVSNSKKERVKNFCRKHRLHCITHAKKPFPRGIRECMEQFAIPAEECALVGDQIFTDTLGANCCGVTSILIKAIHNHTIWLKLRHAAEMPFILLASKRRIKK